MQTWAQMLMWLMLVLALIPLSLWLLKRSGTLMRMGSVQQQEAVLRTVSQTGLGPGQRVVVMQVNAGDVKTWLVLGVNGQQMVTLAQLPAPADASVAAPLSPTTAGLSPTAAPLPPVFSDLLSRVLLRTSPAAPVARNKEHA